jgi:ABC-type transport system involved in multi-copper enzyme maturation permease subunit
MSGELHVRWTVHRRCLRAGAVLYLRDLRSTLSTPLPYLLMTGICLLSSYFLGNLLNAISSLSLIVSADPTRIPLFISVIALGLYLGITSSLSISHEREQRTLEILFYGPVTPFLRIAALFFRDLTVFAASVAILLLEMLLVSIATNLPPGIHSLRAAGASLLLVCPMISLSLLISTLCRRARASVLLFVCLFAVLAGLQVASMVLSSIPTEGLSLFMLYLRRALSLFLGWARWVSPFSYLVQTGGGLTGSTTGVTARILLAAVAYSIVLLAAARFVLAKKGKGL